MRIFPVVAIAAALIATPALAAKPAKAPAAAAKPAPSGQQQPPTEIKNAVLFLKVIISGLQSDKVEQPVKSALVGCLYNNSLGKITDSVDKLIADNPGKVNLENPSEVLSAIVAVCGYRPSEAAAAGAAPAAQPSKPAAGR